MHPYTNMPDDGFEVVADNCIDAFAEKFRALAGRTRPHDFYDVVNLYDVLNLYRNIDVRKEPSGVR